LFKFSSAFIPIFLWGDIANGVACDESPGEAEKRGEDKETADAISCFLKGGGPFLREIWDKEFDFFGVRP
jgi:hypothetical protein